MPLNGRSYDQFGFSCQPNTNTVVLLRLFSNFKTELNVGLLILTGLVLLGYASIRVTTYRPGLEGTYNVKVYFDNVTGLATSTAVRVAGIQVGEVAKIELVEGRAQVTLAIFKKYQLRTDSKAVIKSIGILGDKYIEVTMGSSNAAALQHGDAIRMVAPAADLDSLIDNFSYILDDIRGVTKALNNSVGGKRGEEQLKRIMGNVEGLTESLEQAMDKTNKKIDRILNNIDGFTADLNRITSDRKIDSILTNVDRFTEDLSGMTQENREELKNMIADLRSFSGELNQFMKENRTQLNNTVNNLDSFMATLSEDTPEITGNLKGILKENRDNLKSTMSEVEEASQKLNSTMANLDNITEKLDRGEGTIGRLLNDEETVDGINEAIDGINKFINPVNKLRIDVGFQTEYLGTRGDYKSYVNLNIKPTRDHYYMIKVVSDPNNPESMTRTQVKDTETGAVLSDKTEYESKDGFKFTLMIAQRYFDTEFRLGLIENTAGFGVDQYFGRQDQFRLNMDVWEFSRRDDMPVHLRIGGYWRFLNNLYLVAGVDDILNNQTTYDGKSYKNPYVGIGLNFNEDYIKSFLGTVVGTASK